LARPDEGSGRRSSMSRSRRGRRRTPCRDPTAPARRPASRAAPRGRAVVDGSRPCWSTGQRRSAGATPRRRRAASRRRSHVAVWKAPATCNGMTRVPATGDSASAASAGRAPAATICPPPLWFAGVRSSRRAREHGVAVAADDRAHAGLLCAAASPWPAADADEAHAVGGEDARPRRRRPRRPSARRRRRASARGSASAARTGGRHDERLGDLRVADAVGIPLGAVLHEVDSAASEYAPGARRAVELEPRREESGVCEP
jgi:hypothetical protein